MFKINKKLLPIILLTFVNILGFTLLIPVLPFVVDKYGGSSITYGALIAAYPTFQFLGAPILGSLSDKYGRRPVLIISQWGTLFAWLIFAGSYFVPNSTILFNAFPLYVIALSRIVDGITGGNISVASAYLADMTTKEERTRIYGIMGGIMGIGLMIGPVIGGVTNSFSIGYLGTSILAILLSLVTLVFMYRLPESHNVKNSKIEFDLDLDVIKESNIFKKLKKYKNNKFIYRLLFIRFFLSISFYLYVSIIVLYIIDEFHLDTRQVGLVFLALGVGLIINQAFLVHKFSKSLGDYNTFNLGQIILGISLLSLIFVSSLWVYLLIAYLVHLGFSLTMTTFKSILTKNVKRAQAGEVTGIEESIVALTGAFTPVLSGILYHRLAEYSFGVFALVLILPYALIHVRRHVINVTHQE